MKSMKEVCQEVGINYETLKFYCNQGLVPNHKRDGNNHRRFSEADIGWLKGLLCLRDCGMSLKDMKQYMGYCYLGVESIPNRQAMLDLTRLKLLAEREKLERALQFIDEKQAYYEAVIKGEKDLESYLMHIAIEQQ